MNKPLKVLAICLLLLTSCASVKIKKAPKAEIIKFEELPMIGFTESGDGIRLGGFSALHFVKKENNLMYFRTITDRGPNAGEVEVTVKGKKQKARPFLLPTFVPSVVDFTYDTETKKLKILKRTEMKDEDDVSFSGLPAKPVLDMQMEHAVDIDFNLLTHDTDGADSEGYCENTDHKFVADEYGPFLYMFNKDMQLENMWSPGKGLPTSLLKRKINRGFEGLACDDENAYLILQSPLEGERYVRLMRFNFLNAKVETEYFYPVDAEKADKIGDIAHVNKKKFIVIEQNGKVGATKGVRSLFTIDLAKPALNNVVEKEFILNLNDIGLENFEKIEGVAVVSPGTVALIVDNDFGLTGDFDKATGKFETKADSNSYFVLVNLIQELY